MLELGYGLSSEEHGPTALIESAKRAEDAGFAFAVISDHYHPWIDQQGQSPFVWSVLGGIARETNRLRVGTGVTCPLIRMHPALIAQAARSPPRFAIPTPSRQTASESGRGWDGWAVVRVPESMLIPALTLGMSACMPVQ
jgi:G6PDH family F420-dependent oxidoreductase